MLSTLKFGQSGMHCLIFRGNLLPCFLSCPGFPRHGGEETWGAMSGAAVDRLLLDKCWNSQISLYTVHACAVPACCSCSPLSPLAFPVIYTIIRAIPRQWLLQEKYDAPRPQPSHDVVARFSNVSLDIPAASARKACDLVAEGEDDGSSPHKGAPRTPQTAAREAASEAAREAARGTTRDPADATKRSIRRCAGACMKCRHECNAHSI